MYAVVTKENYLLNENKENAILPFLKLLKSLSRMIFLLRNLMLIKECLIQGVM